MEGREIRAVSPDGDEVVEKSGGKKVKRLENAVLEVIDRALEVREKFFKRLV